MSFACASVEAARPCHQAVTNGTLALISLDTEVPGQPSVTALHWLHVGDVTCRNDGHVTALVGRQTSLDDQSRLKYAGRDTGQDFSARPASENCQILLPCAGVKMVRTKGAQRPSMPPWSLRIRAWHDDKLNDDTTLGACERNPCIACGKITSPCQLFPICLVHAHDDCTHRFAKRDSGDDGAEEWDHTAWTGQNKCFLVALQTELEKKIAKDSEAVVFEQEARKFFLAWRQVCARRDEHAKVCSLCWPLLFKSQHMAAVANDSRLYAKGNRTCPEFGHHSIQMQPTPPEFYANATDFSPEFARITCQCKTHLSRIRSIFHTSATFFCGEFVPNYIQMQPTLVPNR